MIEAPEITMTAIATNRFLPDGQSVCLYGANGASNLTLGQLANALSVRLACVYESRSVSISNRMSSSDNYIQAMSAVGEQIVADGTTYKTKVDLTAFGYGVMTIKNFLLEVCGFAESDLPEKIESFNDKMTAFAQLKTKLDTATSKSQDLAITLKTCVNRRDVAYSTSTNVSKHYNATMLNVANRLK